MSGKIILQRLLWMPIFNFLYLESSYSTMSTMKQYQKKFTISFCETQRQVQLHESVFSQSNCSLLLFIWLELPQIKQLI